MKRTSILIFTILVIVTLTCAKEDIPNKIMTSFLNKVNDEEMFDIFSLVYKKDYTSTDLKQKSLEIFKSNLKSMKVNEHKETKFSSNFDTLEREEELIPIPHHFYSHDVKPDITFSRTAFTPIDHSNSPCMLPQPSLTTYDMSCNIPLAISISATWASCMRNNKTLIPLSTQQLIDCSKGSFGISSDSMNYLYNTGLYSVVDYPLTGKTPKACSLPVNKVPAYFYSIESSPYMFTNMALDLGTIYQALTRGPIIVGFNFYQGISTYKSGILTPASSTGACSFYWWGAVVGYGVENNVEYWIIRSYYNSTWGEKGNFRLVKHDTKLNWGINCGYQRIVN